MAPCAVTTYQQKSDAEDEQGHADSHHDWRRLLRALESKQEVPEAPRELQDIMAEDMQDQGRHLASEDYWARTERYCMYYPSSCYNYCDWYPSFCDEFCERLPQYCVPDEIRNFYAFLDIVRDCEIYSFYGPNWSEQVEQICARVNFQTCNSLRATTDGRYREMSVQQLDHMWQNSYTQKFQSWNPTFATDYEDGDQSDIDLSAIDETFVENIYLANDKVCDADVNQGVLSAIPT